ncbi:polysaccharide lyase family 8 super-sandwich domain-containing protein [Chengkuizengella axinellae]|uniref:Polysaccharide lyase family 8 super-sandwich domain-containing protein n=1 Tax=Chengkuizengella axinellae TaxID=3064388 RepID=A0ABT9IZP2_9BACL|nr:polysaccharide lyase family 8 super-sandwich domain-containing protein [Chengkuizengella sp. 2205SS18-9]MDP5274788.1 polysaccharide lyase family 8 super-sandwich domain-containing protein [Chengkuizengella sp. 2205SS18-9]
MKQTSLKKIISQILIITLMLSFIPVNDAQNSNVAANTNLINNAGFEVTENADGLWGNNRASDWIAVEGGNSQTTAVYDVVNNEGRMATNALKLSNPDPVLSSYAVVYQNNDAKESAKYEVRAWMKTDHVVGDGAFIRTQFLDSSSKKVVGSVNYSIDKVKGTSDWTEYSFEIQTPPSTAKIKLELIFDDSAGTVWFDDVEIVEIVWNPITNLQFTKNSIDMNVGESFSLSSLLGINPVDTTENVNWEAEVNKDAAIVNGNGEVTAIKAGSIVITASNEAGTISASIDVNVIGNGTNSLIRNGGFEVTENADGLWGNNRASDWIAVEGGNSQTTAVYDVVNSEGRMATNALKLSNPDPVLSSYAVVYQNNNAKELAKYEVKAWMKTDHVVGDGAYIRTQYLDSNSRKVVGSVNHSIDKVKGTSDWTEYSFEIQTPPDTSKIKLELIFDDSAGTVWFDDVEIVEIPIIAIQDINIVQTDIEMLEYDVISLEKQIQPLDSNEAIIWTSSDESVVTVDEAGIVRAVSLGDATITASNVNGDIQDTVRITVIENLNHVANSGFEQIGGGTGQWSDGGAAGWEAWVSTSNTLSDPSIKIVEGMFYSGSRALEISSNTADPNDIEQVQVIVNQHALGINENETYRLSTWIKTEDVSGKGAKFRVQFKDGAGTKIVDSETPYSLGVAGTTDWQNYSLILNPPVGTEQMKVELFLDTGAGTVWFDDVLLEGDWISIEELQIIEEELTILVQESKPIDFNVIPETPTEKIIWVSSDNTVATVDENGFVTGTGVGKVIITAYGETSKAYDSVIVHVTENPDVNPIDIQSLALDSQIHLFEGRYHLLNPTFAPDGADTSSLVWSSSNSNIATVEKGLIKAIQPGEVEITVETEDGRLRAVSTVTIDAYEWDEFDDLRVKLEEQLLQRTILDIHDPRMEDLFHEIISAGVSNWESINKNDDTQFLWLYDDHDLSLAADITNSYSRLSTMAKIFVYEDSPYYQDERLLGDLISALEWMYENKYNENTSEIGNYWNYERGAVKHLVPILVLLHDYLNQEQMDKYIATIDKFAPNTIQYNYPHPDGPLDSTLANSISNSVALIGAGSIEKNAGKIAGVRNAIIDRIEYADDVPNETNGFYKDGSYVFHNNIAYTGTYGMEIIRNLPDILSLLNDTSWDAASPEIDMIYDAVLNSFEPLMYKGAMMDMVRGRSIAKSELQDHDSGFYLTNALTRYAEFVPAPYAEQFKSLAKYWIEQDTYLNYEQNLSSFSDFYLYDALIADENVQPRGELSLHKTFSAMDRVVNHKTGYAFGISMYSDRIQNYEENNGNNLKGWHTGSGMTYLYNDDLGHYSDGFWPTVDPYRIPGTTIDTQTMQDEEGKDTSTETWVGGVTFQDLYGTAGMSYDAWESSLTAKKSWFMFDDEIVAVGAGITSGETTPVETIVENRKIRDDGTNQIVINGQVQPEQLGWEQTVDQVEWVHLEGNVEGSAIGYYFPDPSTVQVKKEERTGSWRDINEAESDDPVTRSYMTMWFDHGVQPQEDKYAYVLLPNYSAEAVETYTANPDIEILRNDETVQAVQSHSLGILGANFWNNEQQTVGDLTVYQQASVMMQTSNGELEISISDPTQQGNIIEIELNQKALQLVEAHNNITVQQFEPFIKLIVDVTDAAGQSFTAKFKLEASELSGLSGVMDEAEQLLLSHEVGTGVGDISAPDHGLLQTELDNARIIFNDAANQPQEAINEAEANLRSAIEIFKESIIQAANDISELISIIDETQQFHDQAEEGNAVGQYPNGSKEILQNVIYAAQILLDDAANQTQAAVDRSVETLQEALDEFKASVKEPNNVQFKPKVKKGERKGTTRVEAEIDESKYRLVIEIDYEKDETSSEMDPDVLPAAGEGVIDPYTIGEDIVISAYDKNNTYLNVYLVDEDNQVVDYKQLKLTNGKIK